MLPDIKRILYTTNLGDHTRTVLRHAVSLARHYQAKITILHVVAPLDRSSSLMVEAYMPAEIAKQAEALAQQMRAIQSQQVLDHIKAQVERFYAEELGDEAHDGLFEQIIVASGSPAEVIVHEADKLHADLIVVGREPSSGGLKAALLGSTPRRVTLIANKPVLVVPMGSGVDWEDGLQT